MTQHTQIEPLEVGPSEYFRGGRVEFRTYRSGETAIIVNGFDGKPQLYVATVALVPTGAPHPGEYGVWLKGWSENEGVPAAFEAAGILTLTSKTYRSGFAEAQHAVLSEQACLALSAWRTQFGATSRRSAFA